MVNRLTSRKTRPHRDRPSSGDGSVLAAPRLSGCVLQRAYRKRRNRRERRYFEVFFYGPLDTWTKRHVAIFNLNKSHSWISGLSLNKFHQHYSERERGIRGQKLDRGSWEVRRGGEIEIDKECNQERGGRKVTRGERREVRSEKRRR